MIIFVCNLQIKYNLRITFQGLKIKVFFVYAGIFCLAKIFQTFFRCFTSLFKTIDNLGIQHNLDYLEDLSYM